ncbi:MAG: LPS-assembly protein LptD [Succinivibrio sp.]
MKASGIKQFSYTALAAAVSLALVNQAYAQEQGPVFSSEQLSHSEKIAVNTHRIPDKSKIRSQITGSFTQRTLEAMSSPASEKYLKNTRLSDAATFPMRLVNLLNDNPWKNSPKFPIPKKDLACFYGVPSYRTPVKFDQDTTPIRVTADTVSGDISEDNKQILVYRGKVEVTQADRILNTEKLIYSGQDKTMTSEGGYVLHDPEYTVSSDNRLEHNLEEKVLTTTDATYVMNGSVLSGTAESMVINNKAGTKTLKGATISGCPAHKRSWHLSSSSFEIEKDDYFASAWNDVLYLGNVPVFYTPYANIPITKKRRSGLLPISLEYSSGNGFSYTAPIYLNLAPNYDATLTPGRDAKHGNIYEAEFRYLPFNNVSGTINGTYLPNDPHWYPENNDYKRWFINVKQNIWFLDHDLNMDVDYSKVRNDDYTYISDISQKNAAITDSSLVQSFKTTYDRDHYDASVELRQYQNMYSTTTFSTFRPFDILPQIKFKAYDTFGPVTATFKSELTKFSLDKMVDSKTVGIKRAHAEQSLKYLVFDGYGSTVDLEAIGFLTHYSQDDLRYMPDTYTQRLGYAKYDDSVNRALYYLSAHAKSTFERKVLDMNHTQTLEPEFKYQYIPYKNQDNIALYDTTRRYDDYYTLFSPLKYAGIDRIANLNSVTAGLSTRLLDMHDKEIFRAGIAQGYNFSDNRVKLYQTDELSTNPRTPIEGMIDALPFEGVSVHAQAQFDPNKGHFYAYSASTRYTDAVTGFSIGASYRFYRDGNYKISDQTPIDLKQIGGEIKVPISSNWSAFGASYKDLKQKYNIDSKVGIKYEDCCYSVTLLYEDYMKMDWSENKHTKEKIIGLQFELKGLFALNVRGIEDPNGTGTHYIPSLDPTNLNR